MRALNNRNGWLAVRCILAGNLMAWIVPPAIRQNALLIRQFFCFVSSLYSNYPIIRDTIWNSKHGFGITWVYMGEGKKIHTLRTPKNRFIYLHVFLHVFYFIYFVLGLPLSVYITANSFETGIEKRFSIKSWHQESKSNQVIRYRRVHAHPTRIYTCISIQTRAGQ